MNKKVRFELLDSGVTRQQRRRLRWIGVIAGLAVLLFISANSMAGFYLDALWFENLGFSARFWSEIQMQTIVACIGGAIGGLSLWATFASLHRRFPTGISPLAFDAEDADLLAKLAATEISVVHKVLAIGRWAALLGGGLFFGMLAASQWDEVMRWWYSSPSGKVDPIFGKDLSFYLLKYPLIDNTINLGTLLTIVALVVLLLASLWLWNPATRKIRGEVPALTGFGLRLQRLWGIWLAVFLLLVACRHWLSRIDLIWMQHPSFVGIDFIGDHWWRHAGIALIALASVTALAAMTFALAPKQRTIRQIAMASGVLYLLTVFVSYAAGGIYWWVRVRPNELVREAPYIKHNIQVTREAFAIDRFQGLEFVPSEENRQAVYDSHADFDNARVWDWRALQATLQQQQSLRTFYVFPDIDLDRYEIDGKSKSVMLAVREINISQLPAGSQSWTNRHFIYTHGYGLTMNTVNEFSAEGGPSLLLKDMPVVSSTPSLKVTRPEIYFGETTNDHVYVASSQPEFDYPAGEQNHYAAYEGPAGIPISGMLRRIATAIYLGDGFQILLSGYITPQTRVLFRRQIVERAQAVAPFLTFDRDPYAVLTSDGRIKFVLDGYSTSASYPLAAWQTMNGQRLNYVRNSVKAVIDAYDGTVTMYTMDEEDPILAAYRKFWPAVFHNRSEMPADLVAHLRYPEGLMHVQAQVYTTYHMDDPQVFYNREDVWQIARQVRAVEEGGNTEVEVTPYFLQTSFLPGGKPEFVQILPLTPSQRNNLIGWMAAGCDGKNYGKVVVYRFPKNRLTVGPLQMEARIDQHPQLSSMLSLWNQQGSKVLRGDMLALPIAHQMVYVEPIYLQAQHSPMPELRIVVIGLENDLVFGRTFEEAFAQLPTGSPAAAGPQPPAPPAQGTTAPSQPLDDSALIRSAQEHFKNYQRATADGRYRDAGAELDGLRSDLEKLAARRKQ